MSKTFNFFLTLHFAMCTLAMIWPGALIANRVQPMVFGLPFLFFWYVLWILVLFVGLFVAFTIGYGGHRDV